MATGMEFVIGETPEIITISGFNPIRREIARRTLEKLIIDGRINPTRIEETVAQCEKEIEEMIQEYGRDAVLEFNFKEFILKLLRLWVNCILEHRILKMCLIIVKKLAYLLA